MTLRKFNTIHDLSCSKCMHGHTKFSTTSFLCHQQIQISSPSLKLWKHLMSLFFNGFMALYPLIFFIQSLNVTIPRTLETSLFFNDSSSFLQGFYIYTHTQSIRWDLLFIMRNENNHLCNINLFKNVFVN